MTIRLVQIAVMFFLKYYILGAVYTTLGLVLGTHGLGAYAGYAYSVGGFAALFGSMLMGEIADRFVPANTMLLICHIVSGIALWLMPAQVISGHAFLFLTLMFAYTIFGDQALPLCARIAFHTLQDDTHRYAVSRTFGTLGFLCAGLVTGFSGLSASVVTFQIAAAASVVLAVYALTLPKTPFVRRTSRLAIRDVIGWDALVLCRDRAFVVFLIFAVAICIPMAAYNAYVPIYLGNNGVTNVSGLMTLGQTTEIALMFLLAQLIRRWGIRNIFIAAIVSWLAITMSFAFGGFSFALIIVGILLRGAGWDFFYSASEVYLNALASNDIKARAQTLLRTATYGLGTIVGSLSAGALYNRLHLIALSSTERWLLFWGLISAVPLATLILVLLYFNEQRQVAVAAQPL